MARTAAVLLVGVLVAGGSALAQSDKKQPQGANPIGVAPGWSTQTSRQSPVVGSTYDEKQATLNGKSALSRCDVPQ